MHISGAAFFGAFVSLRVFFLAFDLGEGGGGDGRDAGAFELLEPDDDGFAVTASDFDGLEEHSPCCFRCRCCLPWMLSPAFCSLA